jgi:hypothetical protein
MHDVSTAVAEARRCASELGAVAIIGTPNPVNGQHLHDDVCERGARQMRVAARIDIHLFARSLRRLLHRITIESVPLSS